MHCQGSQTKKSMERKHNYHEGNQEEVRKTMKKIRTGEHIKIGKSMKNREKVRNITRTQSR